MTYHCVLSRIFRKRPLLRFYFVEEDGEQAGRQERDRVPYHEAGDKCGERHHVLSQACRCMKPIVHEGWPEIGKQRDARKANDVNDTYPCGDNFEKVFDIDHRLYFVGDLKITEVYNVRPPSS
mgnify:CR=1 FL=1